MKISSDELSELEVNNVNPSLSLNSLTVLRLLNKEFNQEAIRQIEDTLTKSKPINKMPKPALAVDTLIFMLKILLY